MAFLFSISTRFVVVSTVALTWFSLDLTTTTSPPPLSLLLLPSVPPTSPEHPAASPSPLLRDVGSTSIATAPSQARMQLYLPLPFPKGCGWPNLTRWRIWRGRIKGGPRSGKPIWCVTKMGYDKCRSLFSPIPASLTRANDFKTHRSQHDDAVSAG
jgi:hypothetical protein